MYFPIIDVLKENFIAKIPSIVTQWLTDNVVPVGSAVVVDESLSISGAAADAKVTGDEISDLKSDIGYETPPSYDIVTGKYINNSGADTTGSNFDRSTPIQVSAKSMIYLTAAGYNNGVAMIATCNAGGTNIKAVTVSTDSNVNEYSYYTDTDTYIIISYFRRSGYVLKILDDTSNAVLARRIEPIENATLKQAIPSFQPETGKYVNSAGSIAQANNFSLSEPIAISANSYIEFTGTGYLQSVAMIALTDSEGTTYNPAVLSLDSNEHTYYYFANEDCYIAVSYYTSRNHKLIVYGDTANISLLANIDSLKKELPTISKNILYSFTNITCIGDSLTFGAVYTASNTYRQAYKPYPTILSVKTGATVSNIGDPGATASSWWARHNNQIEEKTNQLTIIYLGTNGGLTDTIATDMVGDDYEQWADTNTGSYGKTIAKSLAAGSRVVLVKIYSSSGDKETTNSVIEKMGEKFNIPVVENEYLGDAKYHYYPDGTGVNSVHYNDFGYAVFADQLVYNVSNIPSDMMKQILPI